MALARALAAAVALLALLAPLAAAQDEGQLQEILKYTFNEPTLSGWTFWPFADLTWTHAGGRTSTVGTGPPGDADGGATNEGLYLYIEASCGAFGCSAVCPRRDAIVLSPPFDNRLVGAFRFDFHMWADPVQNVNDTVPQPCNLTFDPMGDLTVEAVDEDDNPITETPLFFVSGNQGNQWNDSGVVFIPETSGTIRLEFTGVTGPHWASDIAIDNVIIYQRNSFVDGNVDPIDDSSGDGNDDEQLILWLIVAITLTCAACCVCCYYCPHPYWTVAAEKRKKKEEFDDDTLELKVSARPNPQIRGVGYGNYASNFHPERITLGEDGAPMLTAPAYSSSKSFRSLVVKPFMEESSEESETSGSQDTEDASRPSYEADEEWERDRITPIYDEEKAQAYYSPPTSEGRRELGSSARRTPQRTPRFGFMEVGQTIPEEYGTNGAAIPPMEGEDSRLSTILESQMSQSSYSANGTMRSTPSHQSPHSPPKDGSEAGSQAQAKRDSVDTIGMSSQPDVSGTFHDANGSVASDQANGNGARARAPSFVGRYDYISGQSERLGPGETKGSEETKAAAAALADDDEEDGVIKEGRPFTMSV